MNKFTQMFRTADGKNYMFTFVLVCSLFLLWGFCSGLLDNLNKHFQNSLKISKFQSGFVQNAFYMGYFLMALPAGIFARQFGYKGGIIIGLGLTAAGAFWFIPATQINTYGAFLAGLFLIATGLACLETIANPYTTVLGPPENGATRINLAQTCNGVGWVSGMLIGSMIILSSTHEVNVSNEQLYIPYLGVGIVVTILLFCFILSNVPNVQATEETSPADLQAEDEPVSSDSIFSFKGRIGRERFWALSICVSMAAFVLVFADVSLAGSILGLGGGMGLPDWAVWTVLLLLILFLIPVTWVSFATSVKRWHDLGYSGWMVLIRFIPLVGALIEIIWLGCIRGTRGANKYGCDPIHGFEVDHKPTKPILKRAHFTMGVLSQFLYVAAQTGIFSFFINYAVVNVEGLTDQVAGKWQSAAFFLFTLGRLTGSAVVGFTQPHKALSAYAIINTILMVVAMLGGGWFGVISLMASFFFMSIMFPTIFALSIRGLGEHTKLGASVLVMSIVGGAIMTPLMGWIADKGGMKIGFVIPMLCFAFIAFYGAIWRKLEDKDAAADSGGGKVFAGH